jgi:hypothetical protein
MTYHEIVFVAASFVGASVGCALGYSHWPLEKPRHRFWQDFARSRPISFFAMTYAFAFFGASISRDIYAFTFPMTQEDSPIYLYALSLAWAIPYALLYWLRARRGFTA